MSQLMLCRTLFPDVEDGFSEQVGKPHPWTIAIREQTKAINKIAEYLHGISHGIACFYE